MALLGKIKSSFEVTEKVPAVVSESARRVEVDPTACPICGDREWWALHGSRDPKCWHCEPSPSTALVGEHFFFDDHGNRFLVATSNGREEWIKQ